MGRLSFKNWQLMVLILLCLVAGFFWGNAKAPTKKTTLLQKVLNRGEIRIGYVIHPPALMKDPNTGKLYGIYYEAITEMGTRLNLKMNWVEETGWSTMIAGVESGRYDMVVGGIWPNSARSKRVNFSVPLFYNGLGVYVRAGDHRFSQSAQLNDPAVTLAIIDGDTSSFIAASCFSKAEVFSLPEDAHLSQKLLSVKTGKADATFIERYNAQEFISKNPGAVEELSPGRPLTVFGSTIVIPKGQSEFEGMINTVLTEMLNAGLAEGWVKKYEKYPGVLFLATPGFLSHEGKAH